MTTAVFVPEAFEGIAQLAMGTADQWTAYYDLVSKCASEPQSIDIEAAGRICWPLNRTIVNLRNDSAALLLFRQAAEACDQASAITGFQEALAEVDARQTEAWALREECARRIAQADEALAAAQAKAKGMHDEQRRLGEKARGLQESGRLQADTPKLLDMACERMGVDRVDSLFEPPDLTGRQSAAVQLPAADMQIGQRRLAQSSNMITDAGVFIR